MQELIAVRGNTDVLFCNWPRRQAKALLWDQKVRDQCLWMLGQAGRVEASIQPARLIRTIPSSCPEAHGGWPARHSLLVPVPPEQPHGSSRLLQESTPVRPNALKGRAFRRVMPLVTHKIDVAHPRGASASAAQVGCEDAAIAHLQVALHQVHAQVLPAEHDTLQLDLPPTARTCLAPFRLHPMHCIACSPVLLLRPRSRPPAPWYSRCACSLRGLARLGSGHRCVTPQLLQLDARLPAGPHSTPVMPRHILGVLCGFQVVTHGQTSEACPPFLGCPSHDIRKPAVRVWGRGSMGVGMRPRAFNRRASVGPATPSTLAAMKARRRTCFILAFHVHSLIPPAAAILV